MYIVLISVALLYGAQLAIFRNAQNNPVPFQLALLTVGLLLFFYRIRKMDFTVLFYQAFSIQTARSKVKLSILVLAVALIIWTCVRALQPSISFWEQLLTWIAAISALLFSIRDGSGSAIKWRSLDTLIVSVAFAAGLLIHTVQLDTLPRLMDQDEALFAMDGVTVSKNQFTVSPFQPGLHSHPYLFQGLIGLSTLIFGQTIFAARVMSAVLGAVGVSAVYLLGKELFGRPTAIFAALFILTWPFHVLFARISMNQPADPVFTTLSFYFLIVGIRRGSPRFFALSGVLLGAAQLFYLGGRLAPLVLVAYLIYSSLIQPNFIRQQWRNILVLCFAFGFTALPQHIYLLYYQQPLTTRTLVSFVATGQISYVFANAPEQIYRSFLALLTVPDPSWYGSSSNLLNFTGGPLFLIGTVVSILMCRRDPRYVLPIGWTLATIILGSTFSAVPPQYQRYYPAVAALALIVGLGGTTLAVAFTWVMNRTRERTSLIYAVATVVALLNFFFLTLVYFPEARYFANHANEVTNQLAWSMRAAADEGRQVTLYTNPMKLDPAYMKDSLTPSTLASQGVENTSVVRYLMGERSYTVEFDAFNGMSEQEIYLAPSFALYIPMAYESAVQRFVKTFPFVICSPVTSTTTRLRVFYLCLNNVEA